MKAKSYKHLFFDLDRTLWDFERNSIITLQEIFKDRKIGELAQVSFEEFHEFYIDYNLHLWDLYKDGKVKKDFLSVERFRGTLKHFNIHNGELSHKMAKDYVEISPTKTALFPDTIHVLEELSKSYPMYIITNGFNEVQFVKLEKSGLNPFFKKVFTSEMVGVQKPNIEVFNFALNEVDAMPEDSIMIGDDQVSDIQGAQKANMDQIFVNFYQEELKIQPTFHVNSLLDLLKIL